MRPLIGASWKMNLTSTEARRYLDALVPLVADIADRDLFVLPPFTSIWVARECLAGTNLAWGAQDVHPDDRGAHTGDVSASMLVDLGCTYVEIGHSERRRDHGEDDALVAAKTAAVLRAGMTPILCVGETARLSLDEAIDVAGTQLERSLADVAPADRARVVVAYEPTWAIGEGAAAAPPAHVSAVHRSLHESRVGTRDMRVIYGGSVDPATAPALLHAPGVDGLFVGRSALDPAVFATIARA